MKQSQVDRVLSRYLHHAVDDVQIYHQYVRLRKDFGRYPVFVDEGAEVGSIDLCWCLPIACGCSCSWRYLNVKTLFADAR